MVAIGLGGFFPPILMSLVRDLTGGDIMGFMLLSEIALGCLIVNPLVLQRRAATLAESTPSGSSGGEVGR